MPSFKRYTGCMLLFLSFFLLGCKLVQQSISENKEPDVDEDKLELAQEVEKGSNGDFGAK